MKVLLSNVVKRRVVFGLLVLAGYVFCRSVQFLHSPKSSYGKCVQFEGDIGVTGPQGYVAKVNWNATRTVAQQAVWENPTKKCTLGYQCKDDTSMAMNLFLSNTTFEDIYYDHQDLKIGGTWRPVDCQPEWRIALIIPLRDREENLKTFTRNIIPFLKNQKVEFTIFAIEQVGDEIFNKAQTMDAGFVEAQKLGHFDCFIFHDVDMLPVNPCNIYRCEMHGVRHLGISRDLNDPHLVFSRCIGGASAFTREQFIQINGFTTVMFGWGGEDDDAYYRILAERMKVFRYTPSVGNYVELPHEKFPKKHFPKMERQREAGTHWPYRKYDGLNTLTFKLISVVQTPVLTRIKIQIPGPKTNKAVSLLLRQKLKLFQDKQDRDMAIHTSSGK